jgi:hypothetical protein
MFEDMEGNLLDGDFPDENDMKLPSGDGKPGGEFGTIFVVTP